MAISGSRVVASRVTGNVEGNVVGNVNGNVVGNVNGNVVGSVASVTGSVGSVVGAVGSVTVVSDKTGYALTAGSYSAVKTVITQITIAVNNGNTSGQSTITTINTAKAIIIPQGVVPESGFVAFDFADATHVRASRTGSSGDWVAYCSVVEFF